MLRRQTKSLPFSAARAFLHGMVASGEISRSLGQISYPITSATPAAHLAFDAIANNKRLPLSL